MTSRNGWLPIREAVSWVNQRAFPGASLSYHGSAELAVVPGQPRVNLLARMNVFLYLPLARCSQTRTDSGLWQLLLELVCPSKAAQSLFTHSLAE